MKQIWHIFQKDVRRHWRETALSLAIMAAYTWNEIRSWAGESDFAASGLGAILDYRLWSGLVSVLVPISWAFVVIRVVQGESLVGDRQFWVTRPYEWKKLLAAKVLFIAVFVNLPLLIADVVLLAKAGFRPTSYVPGLLWMQLLMTLFVILSIAVLAAVTASVLQTGLAMFVVVLYMVGMSALSSAIPSSNFSGPADSLMAILFIGTSISVILWQYARRKTVGSRSLIVGFGVALLLILVATPYEKNVAREYPNRGSGQQSPVQLALIPAKTAGTSGPYGKEEEKEVQIQLPLAISGITTDSILVVSGLRVAIERPDGLRWDSGWLSPGLYLFPEEPSTEIRFNLKRAIFERGQMHPVNAKISLALTLYRDRDRQNFVVLAGEFALPEAGLCIVQSRFYQRIHCRAPLRGPTSLLLTTEMAQTTCPLREEESRANPGDVARGWTRNNSELAEFGISPVKILDLWVGDTSGSKKRHNAGICPGTPLILSHPEEVGRTRTELELNDLKLADYRYRYEEFAGLGLTILK